MNQQLHIGTLLNESNIIISIVIVGWPSKSVLSLCDFDQRLEQTTLIIIGIAYLENTAFLTTWSQVFLWKRKMHSTSRAICLASRTTVPCFDSLSLSGGKYMHRLAAGGTTTITTLLPTSVPITRLPIPDPKVVRNLQTITSSSLAKYYVSVCRLIWIGFKKFDNVVWFGNITLFEVQAVRQLKFILIRSHLCATFLRSALKSSYQYCPKFNYFFLRRQF